MLTIQVHSAFADQGSCFMCFKDDLFVQVEVKGRSPPRLLLACLACIATPSACGSAHSVDKVQPNFDVCICM